MDFRFSPRLISNQASFKFKCKRKISIRQHFGHIMIIRSISSCPLVFFDDILIYSPDWLSHLAEVFSILSCHQFIANCKKCSFRLSSIDYLEHVISENGVELDPSKVQAIPDWSVLLIGKDVHGFFGLIGYYLVSFGIMARLPSLSACSPRRMVSIRDQNRSKPLCISRSVCHLPDSCSSRFYQGLLYWVWCFNPQHWGCIHARSQPYCLF